MKKRVEASAGGGVVPLPADCPLLGVEDVAAYLRTSAASVRKLLDGRPDSSDGELGDALRRFVVRLSSRRRYVARGPFLAWLNGHIGQDVRNEAS